MQQVMIEKPYRFVPAFRRKWPARWFSRLGLFRGMLRKTHGVVEHECRNLDRLRDSIRAGYGIMLCCNHSRQADPVVMGHVARETPTEFYIMASWHLFNQGWFTRFMLRVLGAFSVNREGLDRQAIDEAIRILQTAERPLLIFPEGSTSRTNDHLMSLMEGPAFIARTAAKRRAKHGGGKVVVHPLGIKYVFNGDIERAADVVLTDIEKRLTWRPSPELPLIKRLVKVGNGLLTLKELEHHVNVAPGSSLRERQTTMVSHLLEPLEREWLGGPRNEGIAVRIKNLRMKIFPDLSRNELPLEERKRRWRHLEDTYLAQQVDCYPERYVTRFPSVDRILETIEKFEEDVTDTCRIHGNLKVIVDIGEAIEVDGHRDRSATDGDPLMNEIRSRLEAMLDNLKSESRMYEMQPGHSG